MLFDFQVYILVFRMAMEHRCLPCSHLRFSTLCRGYAGFSFDLNGLRLDDLDDLDDLEGVHRLWSFYVWMRPMPLWTRPEFLDA